MHDFKFELEYFIQTRKEVDTEKVERNKFLHLMIIVFLGACALLINGVLNNLEKLSQVDSNDPPNNIIFCSFLFLLPLLIFITSMFTARIIRQFQIADRWKTLYDMLTSNKACHYLNVEKSLEAIVVQGLQGMKYFKEDKAIFIAMSVMIYFPFNAFFLYVFNKFNMISPFLIGVLLCLLHFFLSWKWLFGKKLIDALSIAQEKEEQSIKEMKSINPEIRI